MNKVLLVVLGVVFLSAAASYAGITGSAHDFSTATNEAWNAEGEICAPCHTPHNAIASVTNAPLWSHDSSSATYVMYPSGGTIQGKIDGSPTGISKLCLSCHDGTVNLDAHIGSSRTMNVKMDSGSDAMVGFDLKQDHPVSIEYDLTDGGLVDDETTLETNGYLSGGKVQCSSCHDVHNEDDTIPKLLRISNDGSDLCLTCHDK
jgi:predicted CXXCH cytochrome family protein